MASGAQQYSNPFSTGGGGEKLQDLVGAYYLTTLLLGQTPRGLESGTARRVRFQRLYEGEPMDDLICDVESSAGIRKLALQLKNDVSIGASSDVFMEVITACWRTYTAPEFHSGEDRMGFGLGVHQTVVGRHYQRVIHWARFSESAASFLKRITLRNFSSKEMRNFVALVRQGLDAANGSPVGDAALWGFLRSLVLLDFDLLHPGSRDRAHAIDCLHRILPPGCSPGAADLFTCLRDLAGEAAIAAGEFNHESLTKKLQERGYRVTPGVACRRDLEILDSIGTGVLGDIRVDIGGVRLDRTTRVEEPTGDNGDSTFLLLVGPPGVGKSGLWRGLVEIHRQQGPSLVLSADRIEGKGWLGFASSRGIDSSLEQLLLAIGTHPMPCLFFDGLDRIEDTGARGVVNDLLRAANRILTTSTGGRRWCCIGTAREDSLERLRWLDRETLQTARTVRVPPLDEHERSHIASHHPHLRTLMTEQRLVPVMSVPFLLDLLTDRRFTSRTPEKTPATEIAVSNVWWEEVIGLGGTAPGRQRQQTLIEVARRAVGSPFRKFSDGGLPAEALTTLEADVVLRREAGRNSYRFAHDLLEDWSLLRLLDQHASDLPRFLAEVGEPSGMARAVQLLGCSLLERDLNPDAWAALLREIEGERSLAPRWRQAVLSAPFLSSRLEELLDRAEGLLLSDEARLLLDLIRLIRTSEIDVDPRMEQFAREQMKVPEEALSLVSYFPMPRWRVWYGVIHWLLGGRVESLPSEVLDEALGLMEIWQSRSPAGTPLRSEIGALALRLLEREGAGERATEEVFDLTPVGEGDWIDDLIGHSDAPPDDEEE